MLPQSKHLLPFSPTHWLCPLVRNLRIFPLLRWDKEILNSPHFLFPLIAPETQRCHNVLTPRPHFLEQNKLKQNDATANPEVIATYCSRTNLLSQQLTKVYASIDSEHKLHQKGLHIGFAVGIKLEITVYFCPVLTATSCWPGNCCTLHFYKIIGILLE